MKIKQLTLKRFCGFKDFTVQLDDFVVFVGPNNGGKTTLLRAVALCADVVHALLDRDGTVNPDPLTNGRPGVGINALTTKSGYAAPTAIFLAQNVREQVEIAILWSTRLGDLSAKVECDANHAYLIVRVDGRFVHELTEDKRIDVAVELLKFSAQFIPAPSTIVPEEDELTWEELQNQIAMGRYAETWRNQVHWATEGQDPAVLANIAASVRTLIGHVDIRQPQRSKKNKRIHFKYVEHGVEHDIAASGSGMRTLISLATAIEMSKASVLLFDEPDSHLHSSLQRKVAGMLLTASQERQVLVASHAPDIIDEVPLNACIWIDKTHSTGRRVDDTGQCLVALGAIGHTLAINNIGADVLLFVEGGKDGKVLGALLAKCGFESIKNRMIVRQLHGFGDSKYIAGMLRVVPNLLSPSSFAVAALLDADFTQQTPAGSATPDGDAMILRFPCKELENLIAMDPHVVHSALERLASLRKQHRGDELHIPSVDEIARQIDAITCAESMRQVVQPHWMEKQLLRAGNCQAGTIKQATAQFDVCWADASWRRRVCPGKAVLRQLRDWLSEKYGIRIGEQQFFDAYEPSEELKSVFKQLNDFIQETLKEPTADANVKA